MDEYESLKLDRQLCFPLYAAARRVTGVYTPYFKPLGLTYTQYIVFMALWERDGLCMNQLGRILYLDNGTLTPLIKKMEKAGYLTRRRDAEDERMVRVYLTDKGRALREEAKGLPAAAGACVNFPKEKAAQLHGLLHELLDAMSSDTQGRESDEGQCEEV